MQFNALLSPVRAGLGDLARSRTGSAVLLSLAIFAACLFGIYTRPVGFLATVWPANAIMLGLLLRMPRSASTLGWAGAAIAYMVADLLTGSTVFKAALLNGANLVGVAVAYLIYARLPDEVVRLRQPASMLYLILVAAVGGAAAGVLGAIANPVFFNGTVIRGWAFWFATEFVNYVTILPVILTAPSLESDTAPWTRFRAWLTPAGLAPVGALVLTCLGAVVIGGPGAIAFPVPALLWCALIYSVFPAAILVFLFGMWALVGISTGYLPNPAIDEMALVSLRLGISLVALAPIMLAIVMQGRKELLVKLNHLATHDSLTGASNRGAFHASAGQLFSTGRRPLAVLMIDLDHFKSVNDTFGHAGGDEVLVAFARRIRSCLRPDDLFGRVGGEEFAVLVPNSEEEDAARIAERIRGAASNTPIVLGDGRRVDVTTSIGVAVAQPADETCLDALLALADAMLYRAKARGRDRVEAAEGDTTAGVAAVFPRAAAS